MCWRASQRGLHTRLVWRAGSGALSEELLVQGLIRTAEKGSIASPKQYPRGRVITSI